MGLTGGAFLGLAVAAAAGLHAAIIWLWPALARQRVLQITARLGLIALGQALLIVVVLTSLNDTFVFFGSWSALLGTGTPQRVWTQPPRAAAGQAPAAPVVITGSSLGVVFRGGSALRTSGVDLAAAPPWLAPGQRLPGGTAGSALEDGAVLRVTIHGRYTGITAGGDYIYLPAEYFQPAFANARFPVVLAFTGYPNDTLNLMKLLQLPAIAARLTAAGRIGPAIYVLANPSVALPRDTECTNIPAGLQVATFFGRDLPQAVARTVHAQSAGWAAIGYSTGAYCAAKLAMLYPGQFSAAISLSGYFTAPRDRTTGDLYGGSRAYRNENSLDWRLQHLPAPPVSVLVASSPGERSLPGTERFLRLMRSPMRGYALILRQGGHNYFTWRRELPQSLEWLSRHQTPARPLPPHSRR